MDESVFGSVKVADNVVELSSNLNSRKLIWTLLGLVISENFRCRVLKSDTQTFHRTIFGGHSIDEKIALEVYESAYQFITLYAQSVASYAYRYQGRLRVLGMNGPRDS